MPSRYQYVDLEPGQIRLLRLDLESGVLTGTLRHCDNMVSNEFDYDTLDKTKFQQCPDYMALSHHWDPRPSTEDDLPELVVKNDHRNELTKLKLRPSLHAALRTIRDHMLSTAGWKCDLWIDAVCINQDSEIDKKHQLNKMGNIYNGAKRVIVWLGDLDDETEVGLNFVESLQRLPELKRSLLAANAKEYQKHWKALGLLTRKPWFQRLWIVQELAAARDAVILAGNDQGRKSVPWNHFASALSIFVSQFEQVRTILTQDGFFGREQDPFGHIHLSGANILVKSRNTMLRKKKNGDIADHSKSLEELLTGLSSFDVSEAHDIVYAILWLSNDAGAESKRADIMRHRHIATTPITPDLHATIPVIGEIDDDGLSATFHDASDRSFQLPQLVEADGYTSDNVQSVLASEQSNVVGNGYTAVPRRGSQPLDNIPSILQTEGLRRTESLTVPKRTSAPVGNRRRRSNSYSRPLLGVSALAAEKLQEREAQKTQSAESRITVNYGQPVFDLCVQVLKYIIESTGLLDIICYHWAPPPRKKDPRATPPRHSDEPDHPTWLLYTQRSRFEVEELDSGQKVTPVVRRINADPFIGQPGSKRRPYFACGKTKATSKCEIVDRVLHTLGHPLARIKKVGDPANEAVIPQQWRKLLGWTNASEDPPDSFWRTLVADKGPDNEPPPARFRLACRWVFDLAGKQHTNLPVIRTNGNHVPTVKEFIDCAIATVWNRRLFVTESFPATGRDSDPTEFVGLGPTDVEEDDVVCILWGCAVPVILRPKRQISGTSPSRKPTAAQNPTFVRSSSNMAKPAPIDTGGLVEEHYTFVGECFIDGMMNGEIFHWADQHPRSERQDFYIH